MFRPGQRKGNELTWNVSQVIQGLDDGVSQLSVGERAKLVVPAELGYGERGFPGLIPMSSTLIFDVELIAFA